MLRNGNAIAANTVQAATGQLRGTPWMANWHWKKIHEKQ
jgi:hypothetical protein